MNKNKYVPGPAVKELELKIKKRKLHEYFSSRLFGNWIRRSVLAIDEAGNKHLITDTGEALLMGDVSIQCQEPLAALARIIHDHKLVLLDIELQERKIALSKKDAEGFMKDTGLCVADTKGRIYRCRNLEIFTGDKVTELPHEEVFVPETDLLYFKNLESHPISGDRTKAECRI